MNVVVRACGGEGLQVRVWVRGGAGVCGRERVVARARV